MQFTYPHGIATVESAMEQAVGYFLRAGDTTVQGALDRAITGVAEEALREVRSILTNEISTLFDRAGQAIDWNEAIERCIQLVEGSL